MIIHISGETPPAPSTGRSTVHDYLDCAQKAGLSGLLLLI